MDFFTLEFAVFAAITVIASIPLRRDPERYPLFLLAASLVFAASWGLPSLALFLAVGAATFLFRVSAAVSLGTGFIALFGLIGLSWLNRGMMSYFFHGKDALLFVVGAPYLALRLFALSREAPGEGAKRGFSREMLYLTYFPEALIGPIETRAEFEKKLRVGALTSETAWRAGYLIALALFKKAVVASRLGSWIHALEASHSSLGLADGWLLACGLFFLEYFDFSSYVNLLTGVSALLGIEPTESFRSPYLSSSPSDYWQRWNVSFVRWVRTFVFFPVLGRTRAPWLASAASFGFVFLWLGANHWGFRFCAAYFVLINLENAWRGSRLAQRTVPAPLAVFLQFQVICAVALLIEGVYANLPLVPRLSTGAAYAAMEWPDSLVILGGIAAVITLETSRFDALKTPALRTAAAAVLLCFLAGAFFRVNSYLFYYI